MWRNVFGLGGIITFSALYGFVSRLMCRRETLVTDAPIKHFTLVQRPLERICELLA